LFRVLDAQRPQESKKHPEPSWTIMKHHPPRWIPEESQKNLRRIPYSNGNAMRFFWALSYQVLLLSSQRRFQAIERDASRVLCQVLSGVGSLRCADSMKCSVCFLCLDSSFTLLVMYLDI
jgi:hypothetical protein